MSSYAVVRTGGRQHRVVQGERLWVDRVAGQVGESCALEVLLLGGEGAVRVGQPLVEGASVEAKIVAHARDRKIRVFKRRRRKGFHKTIGHRQEITELEITGIVGG